MGDLSSWNFADSRSQELAKMSDEILKEPKPREEPKEIHLDEKDEKEDATRDKIGSKIQKCLFISGQIWVQIDPKC